MFARASERQLAVAIGLDSPGRDLVRTYKDFRQARASWFFPPSKANSLYHYVNARVEFHDFDMHLHNMRLAVGDLSARPAGETAAQARVRKGLLAKYEACVKDHATRMLYVHLEFQAAFAC